MITDIHRHFVPPDFFDFVKARPEFAVTAKREDGENIDVDIRGMHFGLNKTFFELGRQIERMKGEGVERAILSLATPFINYYLEADVAV
jgi:aminocarboxymuconate-semialdehyde decarboxylase